MPGPHLLLKEVRAEFLTASAIPVLLGVAVARYETGAWDPYLLLLTLLGAVFMHMATNTANDYFDHRSGADAANTEYVRPFTGGTRLIQEGVLSPRAVGLLTLVLTAAALVIGALLYAARGPVILIFGAAGIFLGYFYTGPPLRLAHRGLGELSVGVGYGLISVGAFYVQSGTISTTSVVASLPMAFLVTCIILINEFQDYRGDMAAGKDTLVVRSGRERAVVLFGTLIAAAFLSLIAGVELKVLPLHALAGLLPAPLAIRAVVTARKSFDRPADLVPANAATIASHALTGLLMTAGFILAG
ncbi:MAG TPA: 1,4-dihydroxy-2-naphthoate octaprenyltransferase [Candidatus Krumholzibacterium sp.]|nr:1,4-dihydroxy-2-naphthoate octaprenyltransferase [Candidatus Krumholzibacterium sp.]